MFKGKNILYLHGRFGPHIMHGRLAESVNAKFHLIDKFKIWNDGKRSRIYLIYAWIYNAFAFKRPKEYDIFLVSGPHFSPVIMKLFRLKKKQKIICHLGDETMYFLYSKWYGKVMQKVLVKLLNKYDALFCEGAMASELAGLNGINKPKVYTTYLGVPKERQVKFEQLTPAYERNIFLFIASGPSGWRTYYKGLDVMITAFSEAYESRNEMEFIIVGEWDSSLQEELTKNCTEGAKEAIRFIGSTNQLDSYLSQACFYFHTSRGDAFPTVVLESMSAGLIPIVSEWTGSKEVVAKVYDEGVVPIDKEKIVKQLLQLCSMSQAKRQELSNKAREVSRGYTEEIALNHYRETMDQLIKDFNL